VLPVLRRNWAQLAAAITGEHRRIHGRMRRANARPINGNAPGTEKCIAIVYQGEDAVRKIRDVLRPD